ncbi:hypothetical protein H0H92_003369 [Tricholoma furcatifolium]|nr:hypothetical protein H0H92_003369 [Tricholoma furcatifolium]
MEEDEDTKKSIPPWVELEYSHMRILAGQGSHVHFTHLSKSSTSSLSASFQSTAGDLADASCHEKGVLDLMKEKGIPLEKVCLLDPKAPAVLSPEDGDGRFDMFLFGAMTRPVIDFPTIRFNAKESVEMPFRYITTSDGSEPVLPPGMKQLLHEDLNKNFEF